MSKRILSLVLAMVMVLGSFSFTFAAEDTTTVEVAETVDEKVQWLVDHEYVVGDSGGLRLEDNIRRAEVAVIVAKALGLEDVADAAKLVQGQFTDVTPYGDFNWANGYINALSGKGVLNGYTDGTIRPANNISLQEVATMMVMAYDEEAPAGTWPMNMIVRASELGLFDDIDTTAYAANATRQDTFVLIYNAINNLQLGDHDVVKAIVLENYRVESIDKDEIVIEVIKEVQRSQYADESRDIEGDQYKVVVPEDFDVEYLLGKVANFTFSGVIKDGKEVLEVVVDDTYEYLQGPVEEIEDDEIVIDGEDYTVLKDERYGDDDNRGEDERIFQTYFNNEDYKYRDFYRELDEEEVDFARVTVKNGKVLFIDAFDFEDIAPVAEDINDDDEVAFYDDDEDGEINELTVDEDAYVLNYANETITLGNYEDIEVNDVMHWYEDENDNLTVVVRPYDDSKVEGVYEETKAAKVKAAEDINIIVDDEKYSAVLDEEFRAPVYSTTMDNEQFYTLTDDYDDELEPFEDEEVMLLLDMFGNVQLIGTENADDSFYALVTNTSRSHGEIRLVNKDNENEWYETNRDTEYVGVGKGTQDKQFDKFGKYDLVKATADDDVLVELELIDEDDSGQIIELTNSVIDFVDEDADEDYYYVSKNVILFVEDDLEAMTIKEFKDSYDLDEYYEGYVVLNEKDDDMADIIVITKATPEEDETNTVIAKVKDIDLGKKETELDVRIHDEDEDVELLVDIDDAKEVLEDEGVEEGAIVELELAKTDEREIKEITLLLAADNDDLNPEEGLFEVGPIKDGKKKGENYITLIDKAGETDTFLIKRDAAVFGRYRKGDLVAVVIDNDYELIEVLDVRDGKRATGLLEGSSDSGDELESPETISFRDASGFVDEINLTSGKDLELDIFFKNEEKNTINLTSGSATYAIVTDDNDAVLEASGSFASKVVLSGKTVKLGSIDEKLSEGSYVLVVRVKVDANTTKEESIKIKVVDRESDDATLSNLTVDGMTVEGFDPNTTSYTVKVKSDTTTVPAVAATLNDSNAKMEITQAEDLDDTATIVVTAEDKETTKTYKVEFEVNEKPQPLYTPYEKLVKLADGKFRISLEGLIKDQDSDELEYEVTNASDSDVAEVTLSIDELAVTPKKIGTTTVEVEVTDGLDTVTMNIEITIE